MRIENKNKLFFASDYHFCHANVIKYDERPFSSVDEMNDELVRRWNNKVSDDDIVMYLGDFCFNPHRAQEFLDKLNGQIHFILGNHDRLKDILRLKGLASVSDKKDIYVKDDNAQRGYQHMVLFHYAILQWEKSHHGSIHIHGHSHQSMYKNPEMAWYYKRRVLDAGCNGWNYEPFSYNEALDRVKNNLVSVNIDHHV